MMEGVVRAPSAFSMTFGWPFSMMATQELVVPRSIPIILPMICSSLTCVVSECFLYAEKRIFFQEDVPPIYITALILAGQPSRWPDAAGARRSCIPSAARRQPYWLPARPAPWPRRSFRRRIYAPWRHLPGRGGGYCRLRPWHAGRLRASPPAWLRWRRVALPDCWRLAVLARRESKAGRMPVPHRDSGWPDFPDLASRDSYYLFCLTLRMRGTAFPRCTGRIWAYPLPFQGIFSNPLSVRLDTVRSRQAGHRARAPHRRLVILTGWHSSPASANSTYRCRNCNDGRFIRLRPSPAPTRGPWRHPAGAAHARPATSSSASRSCAVLRSRPGP